MRSRTLSAAALALFAGACSAAGTNQTVPSANAYGVQPDAVGTSVLKTLTTQTVIGSTVDPNNGDQAPYGITYVAQAPYGGGKFKKGDLIVCNYADKTGAFGKGTTEEILTATAGSKPVQFVQSNNIQGCNGLGIDALLGSVYSADATAKNVVQTTPKGKVYETITGGPMAQPFGSAFVFSKVSYPPGSGFWVGDATSGIVWRIDLGTSLKKPPVTGVITGFKVNKGKPGSVLGPTALAYNSKNDTMYVADGASNILYAFAHANDVLDQPKDIIIGSTGKTFSGPYAKDAKVLYSGSALSGPIAMTLLPNGNLIVANTKSNDLVEIESTGAILDTKSVDKGAAGAVHGIIAVGNATNTVLYFTDVNGNNVQELSK